MAGSESLALVYFIHSWVGRTARIIGLEYLSKAFRFLYTLF